MKTAFSSYRTKLPHNNEGKQPKGTSFFNKQTKQPFFNGSNGGAIQTKLTVGQPGDKYEKEADSAADAVVNNTATPNIQNKKISSIQRESLATPQEDEKLGTAEQRIEEDKLIQEKPEIQKMDAEEEEPMQMKQEDEEPIQMKNNNANTQTASEGVSSALKSKAGTGRKMDAKTQNEMETSFGKDFSDVNIHTDQDALTMNKELGAQAFTHGKDVYFSSGKYNPSSIEGKRLLAHELTHVVQQGKEERKYKIQRQLYPIPPMPIFFLECHRTTSGRANPGPGIQISFNGTNVTVSARIQVSGPASSARIATSMKNTIERLWTGSFSDGYTIRTTVSISTRAENEAPDSGATQINVHNTPGAALGEVTHMWGPGARRMDYNLSGTDINWSPAHEFGHLLGLRDKYSETLTSRLWGLVCPEAMCPRETEPEVGYENNIMGINQGVLESKNVRDIIEKYRQTICQPVIYPGATPPIA